MAANPNSILDTVKKTLGFDPEYTAFDLEIIMYTNAAFGNLQQLGVGGETGFIISDNTTLWSQYVTSLSYLNMVKNFIALSVKLAFDPPGTSFGLDAIKEMLTQLTWRINVAAEHISPPSDPFVADEALGTFVGGVFTKFFAPKVVYLDFASTVTPDASGGNVFYLTLSSDCTINPPINGVDGEHITLDITPNGHSVTWPVGWNFGGQGSPDLSAGTVISGYYKATDTEWRAGYTPGF